MASLSRSIKVYSDGTYSVEIPTLTPDLATHRVLSDAEAWNGAYLRLFYPAPAVWYLRDEQLPITEQWQYYLAAINYGMQLQYVSALMDDTKAFCNGLGLGGSIPRRDYIMRENMTAAELPKFSKSYVCTGAQVRLVNGVVDAMDITQPPKVKTGRSLPTHISQVTPDIYEYLPQTHPHLFYAAVITSDKGNLTPFPNGAVYSWYGSQAVTFMPIVTAGGLSYPPGSFARNSARLEEI